MLLALATDGRVYELDDDTLVNVSPAAGVVVTHLDADRDVIAIDNAGGSWIWIEDERWWKPVEVTPFSEVDFLCIDYASPWAVTAEGAVYSLESSWSKRGGDWVLMAELGGPVDDFACRSYRPHALAGATRGRQSVPIRRREMPAHEV